jgi:hypothetical protein
MTTLKILASIAVVILLGYLLVEVVKEASEVYYRFRRLDENDE